MNNRTFLANGIKLVTFLLGAFGGFFLKIAPPDELGVGYPAGISSFLCLFILLLISSLSKRYPDKKYTSRWYMLSVGFFIAATILAFVYYNNLDDLTFNYPPESHAKRYVQGTVMTDSARTYMDTTKIKDIPQLVDHYGLVYRSEIWKPESIKKAGLILLVNYISLIVCFMTSIFILTEVSLLRQATRNTRQTTTRNNPSRHRPEN